MKGLITFLRGKKTYLVMLIGILTALVAYLDGGLTGKEFITAAFAAVGGVTMRAGIKKGAGARPLLALMLCTGLAGLLLTGCTRLSANLTDTDGRNLKLTATSLWDSKSDLQKLQLMQGPHTNDQFVGLSGLTQQSTGTNTAAIVENLLRLYLALPR